MASNLMSKLILRGLPYLLTYPPIWGSFLNEKIKVTSHHLNTKCWDQLQTDRYNGFWKGIRVPKAGVS